MTTTILHHRMSQFLVTRQSKVFWRQSGDTVVFVFDALKGQLDGIPFHLYAMKEPDYMMMIMLTYGTLNKFGEEKSGTTLWIESRR